MGLVTLPAPARTWLAAVESAAQWRDRSESIPGPTVAAENCHAMRKWEQQDWTYHMFKVYTRSHVSNLKMQKCNSYDQHWPITTRESMEMKTMDMA